MMHLRYGAVLLALHSVGLAQEKGRGVAVFDGKTLAGWTIGAETGHSRASKNKSGGKWVIEGGAIIGSQDIPGNGGIILTEKKFKNFEVSLEMNNDFGPDSGLFLRSNSKGQCYQAMIDYHANGNLMGIYGEGLPGGQPHVRNFDFGDKVTTILKKDAPFALPIGPQNGHPFGNMANGTNSRPELSAIHRPSRHGSKA